jgi:hypothetical protein
MKGCAQKGNNFRPDSTESNKEHGQGLGGSSQRRSTVILLRFSSHLVSHFSYLDLPTSRDEDGCASSCYNPPLITADR